MKVRLHTMRIQSGKSIRCHTCQKDMGIISGEADWNSSFYCNDCKWLPGEKAQAMGEVLLWLQANKVTIRTCNKVQAIKHLRNSFNPMGLKDAKELVELVAEILSKEDNSPAKAKTCGCNQGFTCRHEFAEVVRQASTPD